MKAFFSLLICAAAVTAEAQTTAPTPVQATVSTGISSQMRVPDNFGPVFQQINTEVQANSKAYDNLKYATENIGHRLTGSANGAKAEAYVYQLLKSYGYGVKYQPFEVESWSRISNETKIGDSEKELKKVNSVTLAHSPVKASVFGELIDLGNGLEADYTKDGGKVKGKIALVYLGVLPGSPEKTPYLHRSEKAAIAIQHGATGIILINGVKGGVLLTGTASVTGKLIPIPALCIGLEDGMALKETLKNKQQYASLNMNNFSGLIKARNVIATLKGSTLPAEKIVVGGHLDSWDLATGAIDNGIGSFAIIDMARTLKKLNLKTARTLEFVLFMGEEQGLLGSKAYIAAEQKQNTLDKVRFMLNYDMANNPKGFSTSRKEMKDLFTAWGSDINQLDTGFKNIFYAGAGLHSDHQPFLLEGIPTGGGAGEVLPNNSGPFYHSDGDVFSLVDDQELRNTVRFSAMLAYALANTPNIPVSRQSDEVLKKFLQDHDLEMPLKIAGEWKW
ncbi:M28 family peptidase [Pedobacter sp. N36a]|uniref:M28 family peptidase n=1 Tax=Pedobacter sp. N36a TaxID=2767996 RepID=UPI002107087D|nr:M28 family peptidase [Pedobacter sp. N36a]